MSQPTLASRIAAEYGISPETACHELFRRGVGPWKWPLIRLLHWHRPEIFRSDWEVVTLAGKTTNLAQFDDVIDAVHSRLIGEEPFWRGLLGLRVSARRLTHLARQTFE